MPGPLLALCMIVRNEAAVIARTLESVKGVADRVAVLDTGSTDGTQDAIRDAALDPTTPNPVYEAPFTDFGAARNHVLDIHAAQHGHAQWCLTVSADETFLGGHALRAFLELNPDGDAFNVIVETDTDTGPQARIVRTGSAWRYEGVVHELLVNRADGRDPSSLPIIPGVRIVHRATDPERRLRRLREYDLPKMEQRVADPATAPEWRARYVAFLGQTHETLAEHEDANIPGGAWLAHMGAAMVCYMRRAEMGGAVADVTWARFRFVNAALKLGVYGNRAAIERLVPLADDAPDSPEIAFVLASCTAAINARLGLDLAVKAAGIAEAAMQAPPRMPVMRSTRARAMALAEECRRVTDGERRSIT